MLWNEKFLELFDRCLARYQAKDRDFSGYYSSEDLDFLSSIGYKPRELFDFVEDLADDGQPSRSTALLIAAVRRDYFLVIQESNPSSLEVTGQDVPPHGDEMEGISYLPRLIAKARHKLRGELDPDLMFCCGGDSSFFADHGNINPADFLRQVWAADGDDAKIAAYVKHHS